MASLKNNQNSLLRKHSVALKVTLILSIIALILVIKHLVLQYLNLVIYNEQYGFIFELSNRFDLDDEISLPTWFSFILLFLIGAAGLFTSYVEKNKARKSLWLIIGILGILLSIDEASGIHEFVLQSIHNSFYLDSAALYSRNAWWLVAPFIVLGLILLLWKVVKILPRQTAILFGIGASVMVFGAIVIDALTVSLSGQSYAYQGLSVALEESLEILGSLIILYALLSYLELNYGHKISNAIKQLK